MGGARLGHSLEHLFPQSRQHAGRHHAGRDPEHQLAHRGTGAATVHFDQIRQLLDHAGGGIGDNIVREALGQSLHLTFWAVFLIAMSTLALATLVLSVTVKPGRRPVAAE